MEKKLRSPSIRLANVTDTQGHQKRRGNQNLCWVLGMLLLGVALRLWQFSGDASLWLDEVAVARNIVDRGWGRLLLEPLDYDQVAPLGFLVAEKAAVSLLGLADSTLRLFPLFCAVASLLLLWRVADRFLSGPALPLTLGIFAVSPAMIQAGSSVKPYAGDVAVGLLLLLLALQVQAQDYGPRVCLLAGLAGAVVMWFSYAGVLMAAALGLALGALAVTQREAKAIKSLIVLEALWLLSAGGITALALHSVSAETRAYLNAYWRAGFMPLPWESWGTARWLWDHVVNLFEVSFLASYPQGGGYQSWPHLYVALAVVGAWSLWRTRSRQAVLLLLPFGVTLTASAAHQYPLEHRTGVFLTPLLLVAAIGGVDSLRRLASTKSKWFGLALVLSASVLPAYAFLHNRPVYRVQEMKTLLDAVRKDYRQSDGMYVYYGAAQAMSFYGPRSGITEDRFVLGGCHRGDTRAYFRELDTFRGRSRIWVIVAHALPMFREERAILSYLERIGTPRLSLGAPGVAAYLFDLSDSDRLSSTSAETHEFIPGIPARRDLGCQNGPHASALPRQRSQME